MRPLGRTMKTKLKVGHPPWRESFGYANGRGPWFLPPLSLPEFRIKSCSWWLPTQGGFLCGRWPWEEAHIFLYLLMVCLVRVGVSTESINVHLHSVWSFPLHSTPVLVAPWGGGGRGGLGAAVSIPSVWTESSRQEQARPLAGAGSRGSQFPKWSQGPRMYVVLSFSPPLKTEDGQDLS
jgi:hypothetical protein